MAKHTEAHARILGGLPVLITGWVYAAEPDVGCGESAEIDEVCWLSGQPLPDHMQNRMSKEDEEECCDALLGNTGGSFGSDWRYDLARDDAASGRSTFGMGAKA